MSEKLPLTEEEKVNNRNSFVIGIFIGIAIIIAFTFFYYLGIFK